VDFIDPCLVFKNVVSTVYIMACKYRDALGIPGKGFHEHILGIAYLDVIGTIGLSLLLTYLFPYLFPFLKIVPTMIGLFVLGILLHRFFCVRTTLDRLLFTN